MKRKFLVLTLLMLLTTTALSATVISPFKQPPEGSYCVYWWDGGGELWAACVVNGVGCFRCVAWTTGWECEPNPGCAAGPI